MIVGFRFESVTGRTARLPKAGLVAFRTKSLVNRREECQRTVFNDTGVSSGVTYVYHVRAVGSPPATGSADVSSYSNSDLATMMVFTNVTTGTPITFAATQELLTALNALNAASGRPAVTWAAFFRQVCRLRHTMSESMPPTSCP